MRAVIQRVSKASVTVAGSKISEIGKGFLVLLGVGQDDGEVDMNYIVDKITNLRVFEDENEKMNLSLKDIGGELLVVSQFTLYGDCRKGRRPSFSSAASPEEANRLYLQVCEKLKEQGFTVKQGQFAAMMDVELVNDGPVTILLDSKKNF
ncbi:D-tyrosyl-tRNA(Tyr) deacylase [Anaerobranca californiensis DSM 14826]|uniref:D-aminoacyl-tRNA deacylase n=1 Tax=Anaerobranca californiensis DSM 14826 TaxID=1120989 RepID=A0A1M6LMK9_9FIRM|nr:D-aminoacyl-tRNA deacylase [Anaerobranca californiensis]SHJ72456.1 D-tyrosyl-tRNA(Tyr) deacylase [Anaerobranca californiensis DSM 14826]